MRMKILKCKQAVLVAAVHMLDALHIHLIPRRNGDTPNPKGGVRGVIPEKMEY